MDHRLNGLYRKIRVAVVNSPLEEKYMSYGDHWIDGFEDAGCIVDQYPYDKIGLIPLSYDLYFFVEIRYDCNSIPWCLTPRVLYSWDSHVAGVGSYDKIAHKFDRVYLASKIDTENLNRMGKENVRWLPEACNPRVHKDKAINRDNDIIFIGRTNGEIRRNGYTKDDFISWIVNSGYRHKIGRDIYGENYCDTMNTGKIAFDRAIKHNIGTRVFEASAMGCLPVWSQTGITDSCGMSSLMSAWEHYVPYYDTIESFREVVARYLNNPDGMKSVINKSKEHTLKNHTYAHRALSVIKDLVPESVNILK